MNNNYQPNQSAQQKSNFDVKTTDENQRHGLPIEENPTQAGYKPKPNVDNSTKRDSIATQEARWTQEGGHPAGSRPEDYPDETKERSNKPRSDL